PGSVECVNFTLFERVISAPISPSLMTPSPKLITGPGEFEQSKFRFAPTFTGKLNPALTTACACAFPVYPAATNSTAAKTDQKHLLFFMFVFLVYLVNSFFLNTRTDFRSPDLEEFPDETKNASLKAPLLGLEVDFRHTLVSLINVRDPPSLTFR